LQRIPCDRSFQSPFRVHCRGRWIACRSLDPQRGTEIPNSLHRCVSTARATVTTRRAVRCGANITDLGGDTGSRPNLRAGEDQHHARWTCSAHEARPHPLTIMAPRRCAQAHSPDVRQE
jgi:hypothetical protein